MENSMVTLNTARLNGARRYAVVLLLLLLVLATPHIHAAGPSRKAIVVDVKGVKTEVSELRCSFDRPDIFSPAEVFDAVKVETAVLEVAIPTARLRSVKIVGKSAEVTYDWRGQTRRMAGAMTGTLSGKTDFGNFELDIARLRDLSFDAPPSEEGEQTALPTALATVILAGGQRVAVSGILRSHNYFTQDFGSYRYVVGGAVRADHFASFVFTRGEALATVQLDAVRKLEFSGQRSVTVTLKNGTSTTGTLSDKDGSGVTGWTGISDKGYVYIFQSGVRAIEFGDALVIGGIAEITTRVKKPTQ